MAQCPRCKGDMPLLSKICPICGYTIDDSENTPTPMEYMGSFETLLKDFRAVAMPTFLDSFKSFLAIVALFLTVYFFTMSFMTGAFLFKLLCNISLILLFVSLVIFVKKKINKEKKATDDAGKIKNEFEFLVRSARQEFGKNPEMSRFLDNVTKEMISINDEHVVNKRSIVRIWIIIVVAFAVVFASSTTIASFMNKKALQYAQYGEFQPQIDEFVLSEANSEFFGEVERLSLVVDMLSAGDVEHAKMFVNEFCVGRSGDYDCAEAVVKYLMSVDSISVAEDFVKDLSLQYESDKQKLKDAIKIVEL